MRTVACVVTEYTRDSHADVIIGKILDGYVHDGRRGPQLRVASLYVEQRPAADISREIERVAGLKRYDTVEGALTLGGPRLAVDGVLLIAEHGDYPLTVKRQRAYPRARMFEDITDVFVKYGCVVPVFIDKHFAHTWRDTSWMYETICRLGVPVLAGSSAPLTFREPALIMRRGSRIAEALIVASGPLEDDGFHALEALQCMVERRLGGETGVLAVQTFRGSRIREVLCERTDTRMLLRAALACTRDGELEPSIDDDPSAAAVRLEYTDGLRATVAMLGDRPQGYRFGFSACVHGEADPLSTLVWFQRDRPYIHFAYLAKAIEVLVQTRRGPYPIERTLLTSGILEGMMTSAFMDGQRIETPHLAGLAYFAVDYPFAPVPLGFGAPLTWST